MWCGTIGTARMLDAHEPQTEIDDVNARTFAGHALLCNCPACSEQERLSALKITHGSPVASLCDPRSVSLQELVDNATLTQPRYSMGEDWSDD